MKLNYDDQIEAIQSAYDRLSDADKSLIDKLIDRLEENYKARWNKELHITKANFSRKSALELLAKLGIWMNEKEPK